MSAARGRDRHEDEIGAADGEDGRLRRGAGRVDHHDVVGIVKLGDQRHDLRLVQLMANRDRALGGRRDPVRQRMVKIGVDRRGLQAGKRRAAEDQARQRGLACPALRGRDGDDAHGNPAS